ncbi:MAG TPA: FAD-dependent oxidoreductase [Ohtaekwangia sp.]|nr:FAD-dependent oxidoreductase [Ohtaekwangia sp.]
MTLNTFSPPANPFGKIQVSLAKGNHIAVVGAGAFGGWSALYLQRRGLKVTLIDAWGAGNSRSSSGDETRVIRSTYGANEFYFNLNVRALHLWKENERLFGRNLFINSGVLWLCYNEATPLVDDSIPFAKKHAMEYEYLDRNEMHDRYPVLNTEDLHHGFYDPFGGYLKAREACQAVLAAFINEGGTFLQASVKPGTISQTGLSNIALSNGDHISADAYLFACGSWMGKVFPAVMGDVITCSRQEVYYFGVPRDAAAAYDNLPVWVDVDGKDFYYGIPGNAHRGFKIGVDIRGERFDPTTGDRTLNPEVLLKARQFITHRFPGLADAPLIENRVCPYENSPDGNFIFQSHPDADNVLLLGGGSGHGFKHGPALGELVAGMIAK